MQKILVLRGGALGDFIVTLPALAWLRDRWPDARVELAGNATAAQLGQSRGLLNAVHSQHEARWAALFGRAPLPADLAAWLAEFDLVLNFWPDPDGDLRSRFPCRPGQIFLSASAMPSCAPAAAHYCAPLRVLGLEASVPFFRLLPIGANLSATAGRAKREAVIRGAVAVHPGSGSSRKNWPAENWARLISRLPRPVSLILGEVEIEREKRFGGLDWWAAGAGPASHPGRERSHREQVGPLPRVEPDGPGWDSQPQLLINRPLEELVDHFAGCRLFLGHDSGISHLAAASGARCVLLFGPTDPAVWAPPVPRVRVLRRGTEVSAIPMDDVLHAVDSALEDQT